MILLCRFLIIFQNYLTPAVKPKLFFLKKDLVMGINSDKFPRMPWLSFNSQMLTARPLAILLITVDWSRWDEKLILCLEKSPLTSEDIIHLDLDDIRTCDELRSELPSLPPIVDVPCVAIYSGELLKSFVTGLDALIFCRPKWEPLVPGSLN